ncbi:hypothetical protein V7068_03075 [Bacillus sp. JJ634]
MKKKFLGLLTVMALVFLLVLAGCAPSKSDQSIEKDVKREMDELVLSIKGEPDTGFDPTTSWGRYGSPLFQSTLLKRDHNLNIVNDLAISYEVAKDGSQINNY